MKFIMQGVREHNEEMPVALEYYKDRLTIVALNQCGNDSTLVDLGDLLAWLRTNRPDLLAEGK